MGLHVQLGSNWEVGLLAQLGSRSGGGAGLELVKLIWELAYACSRRWLLVGLRSNVT